MNNIAKNRRELKYYIKYIDYINLANKISGVFSKDKNSNKDGWYNVRSLYFDNKSNEGYHQKLAGIERRNKYRIRIYNLCHDPVKLEIKTKINNFILKESTIIDTGDVSRIISGDYSCLLSYRSAAANRIYYTFIKDHYRPVVIIDYRRDAYCMDLNDMRITFDSMIKKDELNLGGLFTSNTNMSPVLNHNKIIMEIKYNGSIPVWIKNMLQLPRFERCAISKYTLSRYIEG
jgi:SPX domain protein involved in polyphosphate accumulation